MMRRREFLGGLGAAIVATRGQALATGGYDLDSAAQDVAVRVLVPGQSQRRYRGRLEQISLGDGRDGLLNQLTLEEYLYGVVPMEMPSSWPYAALEAQAIVARTFAMKKRNMNRSYDLVAGSADQEYGGITAEAVSSNAAVDASSGLIVLYQGVPANIAYMSCCGGHTEDAARVWGSSYPYLAGVRDPYCADAPNYHWTVRIPWSRLARASGVDPDANLQSVVLTDVASGGRPGGLRFLTDRGEGTLTTVRLRELSGWRMPSTFVRGVTLEGADAAPRTQPLLQPQAIENDMPPDLVPSPAPVSVPTAAPALTRTGGDDLGDDSNAGGDPAPRRGGRSDDGFLSDITLVFRGTGAGHGVGLCQWGARGMALAGATGQEIVAHYFPSTTWGSAPELEVAQHPNG